jgi:hypothetical protein
MTAFPPAVVRDTDGGGAAWATWAASQPWSQGQSTKDIRNYGIMGLSSTWGVALALDILGRLTRSKNLSVGPVRSPLVTWRIGWETRVVRLLGALWEVGVSRG